MNRIDGRKNDELRAVKIAPGYQSFAEGSALMDLGQTRVLCSASVEDRVPAFLKGSNSGWVTAEYAMLPRSTLTRTPRESGNGRPSGRNFEIQRLIGRSLRAVVDLKALGERTVTVDCDVLQADGGTRTAAITAGYVALYGAFRNLYQSGVINRIPFKHALAAVSCGIFGDEMLLDLCYEEDSRAKADFNVVMTDSGEFVEVQGTAEARPFSRQAINQLLELAEKGIKELFTAQLEVIPSAGKKAKGAPARYQI